MIRFVFFDLDGTLYDFPACAEEALDKTLGFLLAKFGLPAEAGPQFRALFWQEYFAVLSENNPAQGFSPVEVVKEVFGRLLVSTGLVSAGGEGSLVPRLTKAWLRSFFATLKPFPGVTFLLDCLQAAGIGLGIISNGDPKFQKAKLTALGLRAYFPDDGLLFSSGCGLAKPDPAIFEFSLRRHGLSPKDALFVGDSPVTDLPGAVQAGLHVVWLNRYGLAAPSELRGRVLEAATFVEAARQLLSLLRLTEENG